MICSTIIPTIGRQSLSRAVMSVLEQDFDKNAFEVIVVNDSGKPLPLEDWMKSPQVKLLHTNRHNRSVARNTGAAVARGSYLHFLDDDDWMLPGAYQKLWDQAQTDFQAGWVYGCFRLVDNDGKTLRDIIPKKAGNCFIHLIASEWLPLQASWIKTKVFFEAGGFAHLNSLEGGFEDIDLSRLVSQKHSFSRTPEIVAVIRYGDIGSTTDYNNLLRQNRRSREKNLDSAGAFRRMRTSAQADENCPAYWSGRIVYYYLVSIHWNIRQKFFAKTASRAAYLLIAIFTSWFYLLSASFWKGVLKPHHNLVRRSLGITSDRMYQNTMWKD